MSFKCYLYPRALSLAPDTQLVRMLCNLVLDIYSAITKLLRSATTISTTPITAALKTIVVIGSIEVTKDKSISAPLLNAGARPMIATTAISELHKAFAATIMRLSIRAVQKRDRQLNR